MHSRRPKVMHELGGQTLLAHVIAAAKSAGTRDIAVVVGPDHDTARGEVERIAPEAQIFEQRERRGTAHAVLSARKAIARGADDILIIFGDTPLVQPQTLAKLRQALADGAAVAVLGFSPADPKGYGRLLLHGNELVAIREEREASPEERKIGFCNGGLVALAGNHALGILSRIGNKNAKGEYYLTDAVAIARDMGLKAKAIETSEDDVRGINTKTQLAETEAVLQQRLRAAAMEAGVTMVAPETVFLSADTKFGKDVTVEPNVVFGPGVTVEDGATIRSFSHIEGSRVGKGARVGPFARLRPGADLGKDVHIGNFVEVKNSDIGAGSKANHLTYLGDTTVGRAVNVGAGTVTCNYDGVNKHRTEIGDGAFIGSGAMLVAPVSVGNDATIGAGSTITKPAPAGKLTVERSRQLTVDNWKRPEKLPK